MEIPWWNSNLYFSDVKRNIDFKINLMGCIGIRKCIQRVFDLAVFRIIGILLRKSFLAVNIYWMPVQNQLKWSVLSFVHKFLQTFSLLIWVISYTTILWRVLKMFFAQKQSKADYSKNIWKEESCRHPFICLLAHCISVKKDYWNFSSTNTDIKATIKNAVKHIEKEGADTICVK